MKIIEAKIKSSGKKYGIVVSRFNEFISRRLLEGCLSELLRCGVRKDEITVVWVPGAFEIPVTALRLAEKKTIHGIICLGAVIRGETAHFDLISRTSTDGIARVAFLTGKPAIFGVLTTDTVEQAQKRSNPKGDNKGVEAARNAIEMVNVLRQC